MRVLNISLEKKLFIPRSPAQKRVLSYSRLFERFDLIVVTGKGQLRLEFDKIAIYPTNSLNKIVAPFNIYRSGKEIVKKYKSEVISVQDPFEIGLVGWLLAKKFGLKFHVQIHGDYFGSPYWRQEKFLNRVRYYLGIFIVKRADAIRVVSQRIKNQLIEKFGVAEKKITIVPIYTEVISHQPSVASKKNDNKFVFLTVGRLVPVKNISLQIEAMAEIIKEYPTAELWIVGDGPEKSNLKSQISRLTVGQANLKLENSVKLLGWQDKLEEFYQQADAFLLTSNYEGWGLVVVEAANYSLPIIMTDVGCAGEIIKDKESGIIVPVGDVKKLTEAMLKVMKDDDLRRNLGTGARSAIEKLPSKEQTLELYKKSW